MSEIRELMSFGPVVPAVTAAYGKCVCAYVCGLVSLKSSSHTDVGQISDLLSSYVTLGT